MQLLRALGGHILHHFQTSQLIGPSILAVTIGAAAGVAAICFRMLVDMMTWLFFDVAGAGALAPVMGAATPIALLALGGLAVGLIAKYLAPEAKGQGIPEVMLAAAYYGGRIRPHVALVKALAAAVTLGSGGSAGRDGPVVHIAAALGSGLGQFLKLNDRRVTLCLACGAAGAIAAIFNAPIAGVMFALEVILGRFTSMAFGFVVLSSATATVVHQTLTDNRAPAFVIPHAFQLNSAWELPLYALMGLLAALIAMVYIRTICVVEDAVGKIHIPDYAKPALGGSLVGAVGIFEPRVFAVGYDTIEAALATQLAFGGLLLLCALKLVCTALTVGSGGAGGVFVPSLFIGAMFGGAFGIAAHALFPDIAAHPGAYALVGMAAVFAGSAHAPITAVLMLFEMTNDYHIILPLMIAAVISTFVSQRFLPDSMYTVKLRRRGIDLGAVQDVNLMDAISVAEAMDAKFEAVRPSMPLTALIMKFAAGVELGYPVVDDDGKLVGVVTKTDVQKAEIDGNPDLVTAGEICTRNVMVVRPEQSLSSALTQLATCNVKRLVVVDPNYPTRVIGMLTGTDVVAAYARAYRESLKRMQQADAMSGLRQRGETAIVEDTLTSGARLIGMKVMDAAFPEGSTLAAVRRGNETIIPRGSTTFEIGDTLVVLSTRDDLGEIRRWLKSHC